jgi:hypothetical protein
MNTSRRILALCMVALFTISCATMQSRYSMLGDSYPPKPEGYNVQVFRDEAPQRPFVRISRLDVHLEKTHFIGSSLDDALPELKKQARLAGADAIIEIRESSSMVRETKIYHVTATGVRYTDSE